MKDRGQFVSIFNLKFFEMIIFIPVVLNCILTTNVSNAEQIQDHGPTLDPQPVKIKTTTTENYQIKVEGEVFYYNPKLGSKLISAIVSPWKDGRRIITLFDTSGNVTFEKEDVRLSFSNTSEIKKFHPNGAVALINVHENPGASLYWYDISITFSQNNQPEWKTVHKHPSSLEEMMNNKYYWDKNSKLWIKQEVIREQPVPRN